MINYLSPDEHDLVVELMNIGVGKAAASLSQIADDEVTLCVPKLEFLSYEEAESAFNERLSVALSGVSQEFKGFIGGTATLLFPEARSLDLVTAMLGEELDDDIELDAELEQEVLSELGNILLNNCLSTIANILGESLHTDLPTTFHIESDSLLKHLSKGEEPKSVVVMLLTIDFSLKHKDLSGHLVFTIDFSIVDTFKEALQNYLNELGE